MGKTDEFRELHHVYIRSMVNNKLTPFLRDIPNQCQCQTVQCCTDDQEMLQKLMTDSSLSIPGILSNNEPELQLTQIKPYPIYKAETY